MYCPKCGNKAAVNDRRPNKINPAEVFRKHICNYCKHIFYTVEFEIEPTEKFIKEWKSSSR